MKNQATKLLAALKGARFDSTKAKINFLQNISKEIERGVDFERAKTSLAVRILRSTRRAGQPLIILEGFHVSVRQTDTNSLCEATVRCCVADGITTLSVRDLTNIPSLVEKIRQPIREIDSWIAGRLSTSTRAALNKYQDGDVDQVSLRNLLVNDLNKIIQGSTRYRLQCFDGIALRAETEALKSQNPRGAGMQRLFRLLMADAYPLEISRNPAESQIKLTVAEGNGPVNALDNAICKALYSKSGGITNAVAGYEAKNLTPGKGSCDSIVVTIEYKFRQTLLVTSSVNTNILSATVEAMLDVHEFILFNRGKE